ncbi:MAG: DUF433 domain-containing protein [Leptolyngbyaceae cyanobacterium SM2_5_2]|nr:DUF433 domain-containing protein [Leptolyngbyaceae cyanobacterium SM2_5_2]
MNGQPHIRDLHLIVRRVIELLALYPDRAAPKQEFPELEDADLQQALLYTSTLLGDRIIDLPSNYETIA